MSQTESEFSLPNYANYPKFEPLSRIGHIGLDDVMPSLPSLPSRNTQSNTSVLSDLSNNSFDLSPSPQPIPTMIMNAFPMQSLTQHSNPFITDPFITGPPSPVVFATAPPAMRQNSMPLLFSNTPTMEVPNFVPMQQMQIIQPRIQMAQQMSPNIQMAQPQQMSPNIQMAQPQQLSPNGQSSPQMHMQHIPQPQVGMYGYDSFPSPAFVPMFQPSQSFPTQFTPMNVNVTAPLCKTPIAEPPLQVSHSRPVSRRNSLDASFVPQCSPYGASTSSWTSQSFSSCGMSTRTPSAQRMRSRSVDNAHSRGPSRSRPRRSSDCDVESMPKKALALLRHTELRKHFAKRFTDTGMRGENVLRIKVKTKMGLNHILHFLKRIDSEGLLKSLSCPTSKKRNCSDLRGFLCYIETFDGKQTALVRDMFLKYNKEVSLGKVTPFQGIEINPRKKGEQRS